MADIAPSPVASRHSAERVWDAINAPLTGELGQTVNPYATIEYEGLDAEGLVVVGTRITYRPNAERLGPIVGAAIKLGPKDVTTRVAEHDPERRTRLDVVVSDKHEGFVRHGVEAIDGGSALTAEGEILLGGFYQAFEDQIISFAEQGIAGHNRQVIEHLGLILGR